MSAETSDSFCILPWIHIYVNPDGGVLPCCIGDHKLPLGNTRNSKIDEIWNSDTYKKIRKNMLEGKRCQQCSACYRNEDVGLNSFRITANEKFRQHYHLTEQTLDDGSLPSMDLKYFDVRWSNICNFKCRSCSSTYSSSWATEEKKSNVYIFAGGDNNNSLYEQFKPHLENIEEFYFAGGEPLLTDKHYDILEHLIAIGKTDVSLKYNTNLSSLSYKKKSVLDLWKHFPKINIDASLDSWGSRAEYIREGTDWSVIEKNISSIRRNTPHIDLQINSVISVFNISTAADFYRYLIENDIVDKNKFRPNYYNLLNPDCYSVNVIPDKLKQKIKETLTSQSVNNDIDKKIQDIIKFLESSKYNHNAHREFITRTKHYDTLRHRKFVETFPEIKELFDL